MKPGRLYWVICDRDGEYCGFGLYLGLAERGRKDGVFSFLWSSSRAAFLEPRKIGPYEPPRVATFDRPYWEFEEVMNCESW